MWLFTLKFSLRKQLDSAILPKRNPFFIPNFSDELHHEIELILKIKKLGKSIDEKFAHTYYDEIGLGIDFSLNFKVFWLSFVVFFLMLLKLIISFSEVNSASILKSKLDLNLKST